MGAGFLGSLTGLGGGIVIVPLLTIAFGVDIHYAIGASLVSVLATSSGAAGAVYLFKFGHALPNYHTFRPVQPGLRSAHGILRSALSFDIRGMIQLGILLLIAIPIVRVAIFALTFIARRDRLYDVVTLLVFGILAFSLFGNSKF